MKCFHYSWIGNWSDAGPLLDMTLQSLSFDDLDRIVNEYFDADGAMKLRFLKQLPSPQVLLQMALIWINPSSSQDNKLNLSRTADGHVSISSRGSKE